VGAPITPKNVQAAGAIQNIIVTWDAPLYNGHAYAEVWGSSTDNLGEAVQVGMSPGAIFVDAVGPSVIRYYWVRFVNILGVQGAFNAVAGVRGETGADVDYLLEVLSDQITESELYGDLNGRIDEIDGGPNGTSGLLSKYTVKVDLAGHVAGYGIAATDNNGTPTSSFGIRADQFWIAPPSTVRATAPTTNLYVGYVWIDTSVNPSVTRYYNGTTWQTTQVKGAIPFVVQAAPTTVNGVEVPAGVYIDAAYIKNGTITTAKIGNATIDDAKIVSLTASKLTAGSIDVDDYIQSTAFISGTQGWRIHGNGFAEFAAAAIRGTLTAAQIDSRGLSIRNSAGTIILNATSNSFSGTVTGDVTGTIDGTAASDLVTTATDAKDTADAATLSLARKLNSDARNILAGPGGLATGSLEWNGAGVRTSGFGVGFTQNGIVAYNSAGTLTFSLGGATGAAFFGGDITAGTIGGSNVGTNYVRSSNYAAGSRGWEIDSNGDAEFNQLTVRSGQVIGALLRAIKVNSFSGLYVSISGGTPVSTTNGPYYLNAGGPPQYLVGTFTMPAPETIAHRIAAVINVQALGGSSTKDLAVLLIANATFSGDRIFGEQVAYNTNSGVFGIATNAAGITSGLYNTATTFAVFVGGFNAAFTIQTIDGLLFGVR
jgi:hypothetical protein